jgi:hypothetical protein
VVIGVCVWGCNECESTKGHAVKVVRLCKKLISLHTNHSSKLQFCPLTQCLPIAHMHVLGVVYLMKHSEWGLAAWCAWVAGGVCFGLGTNYPCRICPRLPATMDLLALAGTRR